MADDHVRLGPLGPLHQQLSGLQGDPVVGVHELQEFPGGLVDGDVAGGGHPAVLLVDDPDAGVHLGVHPADGQADVVAAVVDQQDLQVIIGLLADALDAGGQVGGGVVDGDDDAHQGLFHGRGTSLG